MDRASREASRGGVFAYQESPSAGGTPPGGGPGNPPPNPPVGSGLPGTGGAPESTAGAGTIPVDVLPEELRGKPESQVRMTLRGIVDSLKEANRRNADLQAELKTRRAPPRDEPRGDEPPPRSKKPLGDRLLEEPEAALDEFFATRAGPALEEIRVIREQLGSAQFDLVRSKVPDFDEYAEDVEKLLEDNPRTQENIMGAYAMAVGLKTIEERGRAARASLNSDIPRDEPPASAPQYSETALSEEIRIGLGMGKDDYYNKYAKTSVHDLVKVPT